jgi:TolB-like protein
MEEGFRIAALATAAAVAIGLVTGVWVHRRRAQASAIHPQISSLAVLPLDNLSGDPAQEYLADGMTDELTTMLAKNSTLRIVSRTSAMQYKGAHRPLREIAQALGVDGILEGSVARTDGTTCT